MSDCEIKPLGSVSREKAIDMIASAFASDDPLATSQGISYESFRELIDNLHDDFLDCDLSFAAYDPAADRVAALILADNHLYPSGEEGSNAIAEIITKARLEYIGKHSPPANESLHIHFIASSPDYRRRKLASKLIDKCLANAQRRGYRLAIVEASGTRSRTLLRDHHGFSEQVSIDYQRFKWQNTYPFASIAQHGGLTLMDKKL